MIMGWGQRFGIANLFMAIGHDAVIALMEGLHAMPKYIMVNRSYFMS
jgi:hypothetical protein